MFLAVLLLMVATVPPTMLVAEDTAHRVAAGTVRRFLDPGDRLQGVSGIMVRARRGLRLRPVVSVAVERARALDGPSMGAFYDTYNTLPLWFGFLLSYLALRLLLPEQRPWKRFLLLLLLSVYWSPFDVRSPFAIFLFAVMVRGWYAVRQGQIRPWVLGIGAAFLCAAAFLNNADTGIYGIVALLLSLGGIVVENWRETRLWPDIWRAWCRSLWRWRRLPSLLIAFWRQRLTFASGKRCWPSSGDIAGTPLPA